MAESAPDFGESFGDEFEERHGQVRGATRTLIVRRNLNETLRLSCRPPLDILEMEGGAGHNANYFARMGHRVVLMDSSSNQLARAEQQPHLQRIVEGDIDVALMLFEDKKFDLVTSEGVLQYQKDAVEYLRKLARLTKSLGSLSIVTAGLYGKQARYINEPDTLEKLSQSGIYTNELGIESRAYSPEHLLQMIEQVGLRDLGNWFGVRIAPSTYSDKRKISEVPLSELVGKTRTEVGFSRDKSTRGIGQMIQAIPRKPVSRI